MASEKMSPPRVLPPRPLAEPVDEAEVRNWFSMDRIIAAAAGGVVGFIIAFILAMALDTTAARNRTLKDQLQAEQDKSAAAAKAAEDQLSTTRQQIRRLEDHLSASKNQQQQLIGQLAEAEKKLIASQRELVALKDQPRNPLPPPAAPVVAPVAPAEVATPEAPAARGLHKPARLGDAQVTLMSATVQKIDLTSLGEKGHLSANPLLKLVVVIDNKSPTRKLNYRTWGAEFAGFSGLDKAYVTDDVGNTYKRIHFGLGDDVVGQQKSTSIYPGATITDVLVFELPVGRERTLTVELPGAAIDRDGEKLKFTLLPNQIDWRENR